MALEAEGRLDTEVIVYTRYRVTRGMNAKPSWPQQKVFQYAGIRRWTCQPDWSKDNNHNLLD